MRRIADLVAVAILIAVFQPGIADDMAVITWETLAQVSVTKQKDRYIPEFSKQVLALEQRKVTLTGFMLPLEPGLAQKHFLLTMERPDGDFCGNAEQFAEVLAKEPVKVPSDAIVVSGTFSLVQNDSGELLYRLNDAVIVNK